MTDFVRRNICLFISITAIICLFGTDSYSQRTRSSLSAGRQRAAEKGLKDNRYYFFYIDSSVTNLGSDNDRVKFKEAVQRDIVAQLLYMRFLFGDSFKEIRKAQEILIDIYQTTITRNIKQTKNLLHGFAPAVIRSKNSAARHYLRLGYRDTAASGIDKMMADNYQENLYSTRLLKYVWAMKKVVQAKRFAFLAMLEASYPRRDVSTFNLKTYKELNTMVNERGPVFVGPVDEEKSRNAIDIMNKIEELEGVHAKWTRRRREKKAENVMKEIEKLKQEQNDLDRKFASSYSGFKDKRDFYVLHHMDSYYKTIEEKTLYDKIWEDPQLHEIKELEEYLKKQ